MIPQTAKPVIKLTIRGMFNGRQADFVGVEDNKIKVTFGGEEHIIDPADIELEDVRLDG